jgi:hypothetical protein
VIPGARGRPRVSTFEAVRAAAQRFCPPYETREEQPWALRVVLLDPEGRRPNLTLRHHNKRRLFLKANYLVVESNVPGEGPPRDGEIGFRFRGPLSRQRASIAWRRPVDGGDAWLAQLEGPLVRSMKPVQAVQSLTIGWSARKRVWHLRLETMSGSVVSGITAMLPIAVPFDREEAEGIIGMVDALAGTANADG